MSYAAWCSPSMDFAFGMPVNYAHGDSLKDSMGVIWHFNQICVTSNPLPYGYQAPAQVHVNIDSFAISSGISSGMSQAMDRVSDTMRSNTAMISEILDRLTPKQKEEPAIQNPANRSVKHDDLYKKPMMKLRDKDW